MKCARSHFLNCFSLLEILIVIGILSIIASITFIIINPSETIKKARDSQRMADLDSIDKSLSLFILENTSTNIGTLNLIYISLPDSLSNCASWTLPTLPAGYTYACKSQADFLKTDGNGWIPINLNNLSIQSPIAKLPIDPTNNQNYFYAFTTNGEQVWQISTSLESATFKLGGDKDRTSTDGGGSLHLFEKGRQLNLLPIDYGDNSMIGWWPMNENTGTTTYDKSPKGYHSTAFVNQATWTTGKQGSGIILDGTNDRVTISDQDDFSLSTTNQLTVSGWIKLTANTGFLQVMATKNGGTALEWFVGITGGGLFQVIFYQGSSSIHMIVNGSQVLQVDQWYHLAFTINEQTPKLTAYLNGSSIGSDTTADGSITNGTAALSFGESINGGGDLNGSVDNIRVYNRVLSAQEILAIYNESK